MPHSGIFGRMNCRIVDNYGSRRGLVRTWWCRLLYLLGGFREHQQVDWDSIERLVFVCQGNICRSAYAEAIARSLGLDAVSCGLKTIVDAPANEDAVRAARARGVDLKEHKTTPIMYMVLKKTDLLIAMEPWQAEFLKRHLMRGYGSTLLGLWFDPVRPHIQDPYGSSYGYFNYCFEYIERSVNAISEKVKKPASRY